MVDLKFLAMLFGEVITTCISKREEVIELKRANITEDIEKAWFASLPSIDNENRILNINNNI